MNAPAKTLPNAQLTHVGFLVRDMDRMIDFYVRTLGMVLTDRGPYYRTGGQIAFLSRNPYEHHQIVFADGRPEDMKTTINQVSFIVDDLEDLRQFYALLVEQKVAGMDPRNHGNAWTIYFMDPEGNRIELYTPSPWYVPQPYAQLLDLTESADTIRAKTLEMVRDDPSFCSQEAWSAALKAKIEAAGTVKPG